MQTIRTKKPTLSSLVALILLTPFSLGAQPLDVCFDGINLTINSDQGLYDEWQQGFGAFFNAAREGDDKKILISFTDDDGSRTKVADQMSRFDKFGKYAQTNYSGASQEAFEWGNYSIRNVDYEFRGQKAQFLEPMLCQDSDCKATTLIENSDADSQVLNLVLENTQVFSGNNSVCNTPKGDAIGKTVSIYPRFKYQKINPIKLLIAKSQITPFKGRAAIDSYLERCVEVEDVSNDVKLQDGCVLGSPRSLIPAIQLDEESGKKSSVHFEIDVMLRILADADSIQGGYDLVLGDSRVSLLKLTTMLGKKYVVLFSMNESGKIVFDAMRGKKSTVFLRHEVIDELFKDS